MKKREGIQRILSNASILLRIVEHCISGFQTIKVTELPQTTHVRKRGEKAGERVKDVARYNVQVKDGGEPATLLNVTEADLRKALALHMSKRPVRRLLAAYDLQEAQKRFDALTAALASAKTQLEAVKRENAEMRKTDPKYDPEASAKTLRTILETEHTTTLVNRPKRGKK